MVENVPLTFVVDVEVHQPPERTNRTNMLAFTDHALEKYREQMKLRIDREFSNLKQPIREYVSRKLLLADLKTPNVLLEEMQGKIKDLFSNYILKLEKSILELSLVMNYLLSWPVSSTLFKIWCSLYTYMILFF